MKIALLVIALAGCWIPTPRPPPPETPLERDVDQDGFLDRLDKCPQEAEDKDGFEDDDGCPDPEPVEESSAD